MTAYFELPVTSVTTVLESLLETPIDSRRALAGNLILSGGGARMPGLERRLLQEIETQVKTQRYSKLQNLDVSRFLHLLVGINLRV